MSFEEYSLVQRCLDNERDVIYLTAHITLLRVIQEYCERDLPKNDVLVNAFRTINDELTEAYHRSEDQKTVVQGMLELSGLEKNVEERFKELIK